MCFLFFFSSVRSWPELAVVLYMFMMYVVYVHVSHTVAINV